MRAVVVASVVGVTALMVVWSWLYGRNRPGYGKPLAPIPKPRWRAPALIGLTAIPLEMVCVGFTVIALGHDDGTAVMIGLTLSVAVFAGFVLSVRRIYAVLAEHYS